MITHTWANRRVEQLNDKQLNNAKSVSYWIRAIKLLTRMITQFFIHLIILLFIQTSPTPIYGKYFFISCVFISLFFYGIKYIKDSNNIRGFVDDKFRKEISNNNTTKY